MGTITASKGKTKTNRTIDSFVLVENMKLNETVDNQRIPETQRILFETTYANMKECGKKGSRKYVASIPVELLRIDPSYQRISTSTPSRLKRLANYWREDKLMPMIVVAHPEEYCFYIVDGFHRFTVATTMLHTTYKALDAIVLTNAPKDAKKRQKFEAELFVSQKDQEERVTPIQMHKAKLLIGDAAANSLQDLLDKYNVSYVANSGQREQAILGSYDTAYSIAKRNGSACLEFIFSIIDNAGWRNETNGYSKAIMKGIKDVWCAYPNPEKHNQMHAYYSDALRKIDPKLLISKSRSRYPERSERQTVALYLSDMVVKDLGFEKSLYFEQIKLG